MSGRQDRSGLVREFFSISLERSEMAFMYLGYAGVILRLDDRAMAIDIANLLGNAEIDAFSKLDLLVFTHNHSDHYNRARARRILKTTDVHVVAQAKIAEDLKGSVPPDRLTDAQPGTSVDAGGFEVTAIEGVHPRPINIYRITRDMFSIFHGGDSGYSSVKEYPAKMAFLPTGRPSPSCSPESALRFAQDLKPSVVVAMHGSPDQLAKFKRLIEKDMPDTTIIIPERYRTVRAQI